ncbi:type I-E CRISPR-associated protein Cse1/CasA [Actinacidiphila acididurans]|uniref:Type I-E CRISPR-associated protein Cse1/CasA n=1 Tax=Actinacidiphila acididurans TaxID=2784346 RepID=A0ABS2TXB5_9ACTN|nr:type I-E CRISPR-associated protein Cse1/CasA [Actinacidiphila acididurans]MBM9507989.1 type I-E CRISPR-associated protein Cse1/CasA [Actinacidiphila acididurans]
MPAEPLPSSPDLYDLRTEPWCPVSRLPTADEPAGSRSVGFLELFLQAHLFSGLAVALPPAASGLLRVLYAIAARITGLHEAEGVEEWTDRRYDLLDGEGRFNPEAVRAYFARYGDRFRLFDSEWPWMQDPRLRGECPSSSGVNKLVFARPAGNNQVFFGHFADGEQVPLSSADAALHLLAQLYYGPSGQCTPRTVAGQRFGNSYAGPLRKVLSYHPVGRSLFETLLLGLPYPNRWPPERGAAPDACPWERDELPDPLAVPTAPTGPLSALTEQYRHAVLLTPAPGGRSVVDAHITWALRVNRPPIEDPYLLWDEGKDLLKRPREADADRALWRDLDALVTETRNDSGHRPYALSDLRSQLPPEVEDSVRVQSLGFDQDGQTRDRTYFASSTPPLFNLLRVSDDPADHALRNGLREARDAAEKAAGRLEYALQTAWRAYTSPFEKERPGGTAKDRRKRGGPWPAPALAAYWPAAEQQFWQSLGDGVFSGSAQVYGRIALREYDAVTLPIAATPRGAKAREEARGLVRSLLRAPDRP